MMRLSGREMLQRLGAGEPIGAVSEAAQVRRGGQGLHPGAVDARVGTQVEYPQARQRPGSGQRSHAGVAGPVV